MIVKLIANGIKSYFEDNYNTFDCFLNVFSTIDFILRFTIDFNNETAV